MSFLRVSTLGGLAVSARGGREIAVPPSCRPVLGYILSHRRRSVTKCELAEVIWSHRDGRQARHCLATALWRLRKTFAGTQALEEVMEGDAIALDRAAHVWVDAVALEARLAPLLGRAPERLTPVDLHRLRQGVRLYRGDYLAGMDQEWACLERQRLRDLYCEGLTQLVLAHAAAGEWRAVLTWGKPLAREEPLREDIHRLLIRACMETGNRAAAIAQYRKCERVIARELGIAPMAETQALHRRIVQAADVRAEDARPIHAGDELLVRVGDAQRLLSICQQQLEAATEALARSHPTQGPR